MALTEAVSDQARAVLRARKREWMARVQEAQEAQGQGQQGVQGGGGGHVQGIQGLLAMQAVLAAAGDGWTSPAGAGASPTGASSVTPAAAGPGQQQGNGASSTGQGQSKRSRSWQHHHQVKNKFTIVNEKLEWEMWQRAQRCFVPPWVADLGVRRGRQNLFQKLQERGEICIVHFAYPDGPLEPVEERTRPKWRSVF